ncbi:MAG: NAD(P)/FAD-dependent oxidoreductase [Chloroflexi bacterium]|nr:NAD(P)/FAD-dependent oxidoreductase [Chloroflexota bacterium]
MNDDIAHVTDVSSTPTPTDTLPAKNIAILGAGIAGLTAGYDLTKAGHRVTIFEKWPGLGGQASTFPVTGTRLERYYHHLFTSDRDEVQLMEELGIGDKMTWHESKMGIFRNGRIYDFVTPIDLLKFTAIPLIDRLRAGLIALYAQRIKDWRPLEQITAATWARRYFGEKVYAAIWGPLVRGKFGDYADQVSMAWLWGKLALRRSLKGEGILKEKLGYPAGSWEVISQTLADAITSRGGRILLDSPATRILVEDGRACRVEVAAPGAWRLPPEDWERGEVFPGRFDAILATVPSFIFTQIVPDLPPEYRHLLSEVRYQSALVMLLQIKRSLSRIYWLNIAEPDIPFVGLIEHTNLISPETYEGKRFLYIANYVDKDTNPLYGMTNEELLETYLPYIQRVNPEFNRDWIEKLWVFREDAAQPIITCGYSQRIPDYRTPIPGLYLANTTQIYPEDRGTNYSVRLGRIVAHLLHDDMQATGLGKVIAPHIQEVETP